MGAKKKNQQVLEQQAKIEKLKDLLSQFRAMNSEREDELQAGEHAKRLLEDKLAQANKDIQTYT